MEIYVGNLSFQMDDEQLNSLFAEFGSVSAAKVIIDRDSGRSRGFGFVTMASNEEGQKAIDGLNGSEVGGRALRVNEARERKERPPRRDFRGGGGGGGGRNHSGGGNRHRS